jgi:hypothetical protein
MAEHDARAVVPALGWSRPMADVVTWAANGWLWQNGPDGFRHQGRKVKADRVSMLLDAGFLYRSADGRVYATADGERAMYLAGLHPAGVHPDDKAAHEARLAVARRDRSRSLEDCKSAARRLPVLPGGEEEKRRRAAFWAQVEQDQAEAAKRRAETDALLARAEEQERAEQEARRERERERERAELARLEQEAAERAPYVREAERRRVKRAGRSEIRRIIDGIWHVTYQGETYVVSDERGGLWLVAPDNSRLGTVTPDADGAPDAAQVWALLTGAPVDDPQGAPKTAADVVSDPATVDGWEGDGGACPDVAAPLVDETWRHPHGGTTAPVLPALPVSRGVTGHAWWESGERATLARRAGRTAYDRVADGSDSLDVFAALDAELSAAAADWDQLIPA